MKYNLWTVLLALILCVGSIFYCSCDDDDDDNDDASGDDDTTDDDDTTPDDDDDTGDDDTGDDDTGDDDTGDDDTGDDDTGDDDTDVCTGCLIGEECYDDGDTNPANVCEICDVSQSTTDWTDNDGASCEDGTYCNGDDTCLSGVCDQHAGDPCPDDGEYCNGTESCDEANDECDHTGDPCSEPRYCNEDEDECLLACYEDADFDQQGNPDVMQSLDEDECPAGYTTDDQDCDDTDPLTFTGAPELPDDGIDQNCDDADLVHADDNGIFVSGLGNDDNPGTMALPKLTVQAAVTAALAAGKVVYVDLGVYPESVTSEVSVFGGYDATEGWSRDIDANVSEILATAEWALKTTGTGLVAVEGLSLGGGAGANATYGLYAYTRTMIVHNDIDGGHPTGTSTGVQLTWTANGSILYDNTILGGTDAARHYGVNATAEVLLIDNLIMSGDTGSETLYAVELQDYSSVLINNVIVAGTGTNMSYGVEVRSMPLLRMFNNTILGGSGNNTSFGVANITYGQTALLVNNIITAGTGTGNRIALYNTDTDEETMLIFNDLYPGTGSNYLRVNSTYVTTIEDVNSCGWDGCIEATGNIGAEPGLADPGAGDYHLSAASECIDAGFDATDWFPHYALLIKDFEGDDRPQGLWWDIGADEWVAP
ncbi:MAG TPA: hypothetical protein PKW95_24195 [bacterium]|nr:hypothetical protein [bacterium]